MKYAFFLYFFSLSRLHSDIPQLPEYESFAHFNVDAYATSDSRTFDRDGIIMQKGDYHPLTISIYGIMNYDAFVQTGDSVYYHRFVDQYKYFSNASNIVFSDNNASAGLPYLYPFQGLPQPWYSGMTQGTAVSYLLRYYSVTKDQAALKLSRQLMHLLMKDEKEGGAISRTLEGGMWIEEYPNSKDAKSVMNGFINGLIGVHEYCLFHPKQLRAATIRDSCYTEMIENVHRYDKPDWTMYARYTKGGNITIGYLKYQLQEFIHLYSLYPDERLRKQMKIWSMFAYNKADTEIVFLKKPEYQYGRRLDGNPFSATCTLDAYSEFITGMQVQQPTSISNNVYRYRFGQDQFYCELKLVSTELKAEQIKISVYRHGRLLKTENSFTGSTIIIQSDSAFEMLTVNLNTRLIRMPVPVVLSAYDYRASSLSMFGFYSMPNMFNAEKNRLYRLEYEGKHLTNATVFYRFAPTVYEIIDAKWTITQSFHLSENSFALPEDGVYQFFLSYDLSHPYSQISGLQLVTH